MAETAVRYRRRELTARKEYFNQTDEVLGLFQQAPGQAEKAMKAIKIYDTNTGGINPTDVPAKKQAPEDEYPCLRAAAWGFAICMVIWLVAHFIVNMG